jgi:uncharacterized protein YajQ (UPF0234 family)
MPSFDIVCKTDQHEITNAVDQANREVNTRFDFKGSQSSFRQDKDKITLESESEFQIKQMTDILYAKMAKRSIDPGHLEWGKIETANQRAVQIATVKEGIDKDLARKLVKLIKDTRLKVQAQIQDDQVRVSGKNRDDLQQIIAVLRKFDSPLPLQFINFRD